MRLLYLHDGIYDVVSIALKKCYEVVDLILMILIILGILLIILIFCGLISLVKYQGL